MGAAYWIIVSLAGLLAWAGAWWSLTLPIYEQRRRTIPARGYVTVALAMIATGIAAAQGENW
ncbi:MAG: hypothetical protein ACRDIB_17835, partial [Ardenticatenaceae bacterium]